jgi:hypothetical protein
VEAKTEADRFIEAQLRPLLLVDETVESAAYFPTFVGGGVTAFVQAAKKAVFMALTNQRLILIQTRLGAFKPLLENHGVIPIGHSAVRGVHVSNMVRIEVADGSIIEYQNAASRAVSTQAEFLARLQTRFGISHTAARLAKRQKTLALVGAVIAVGLVVAVALYTAFAK